MSNLLPREAKRSIITEFRLRLIAVWCFVLATSFLVVAFLFLPSFVSVYSELRSAESALVLQTKDTGTQYASTLKEINEANTIGVRLGAQDTAISITEILREINKELGTGITFNSVTMQRVAGTEQRVQFEGVASTREELARFIERLKANPYIADASVPFSQLAQAANSTFTATILMNKERTATTP